MEKKNKQVQIREIPSGIKIISIFYYICSIASAIYFLVNIILLILLKVRYSSLNLSYIESIIIYILFSLLAAVIFFILARGLWKLKHWARISSIDLSIAIIIYLIYDLIKNQNIISVLIIWGFAMIITHLLLNEKVKETFKDNS